MPTPRTSNADAASATPASPDLPPIPTTPDELHAWISTHLNIQLARTPVIDGHAAPFDYLIFTFFEGRFSPPNTPTDCVVWANRGGGKTFLGAIATLLDLLYKPGIQVRVLAGSLDQAGHMMDHLRHFLDENPTFTAQIDGRPTERRITLKNKSRVEVLAQSHTSVRGTRVQKLRCDEVDLFDQDLWQAAQLATRSKTCGNIQVRGSIECLSTMHNPSGIMHDLVDQAKEGKRRLFKWGVVDVLEHCTDTRLCHGQPLPEGGAGVGSFSTTQSATGPVTLDPQKSSPSSPSSPPDPNAPLPFAHPSLPCPLLAECKGQAKSRPQSSAGHLSIEDAITMKGRVAPETWDTEMLCLRPKRTDAVFPTFSRRIHVFSGLLPVRTDFWLAGMDFGIRAPTVVLWAALDDEGILWIVDERSVAGEVLDNHIAALRSGLSRPDVPGWPRPKWIAADPAGESTNSQSGISDVLLLRRNGFKVLTPRSHIHRGLLLIRQRLSTLARPRLFVHERCEKLIESFERYHYNLKDKEDPDPVKDGFDHAADALRYLVVSLDCAQGEKWGSYLVGNAG